MENKTNVFLKKEYRKGPYCSLKTYMGNTRGERELYFNKLAIDVIDCTNLVVLLKGNYTIHLSKPLLTSNNVSKISSRQRIGIPMHTEDQYPDGIYSLYRIDEDTFELTYLTKP